MLLEILENLRIPLMLLQLMFLATWLLPLCGGGSSSDPVMDEEARQARKREQKLWREKGAQQNLPAGAPKPPSDSGVQADSHDPNYQTLAGLSDDLFDKKAPDPVKPAARPPAAKAPAKGGMAATQDPNYQTLAGVSNDCFQQKSTPNKVSKASFQPKTNPSRTNPRTPNAKPPNIRPPTKGGKVATTDPNYQTLAGINDNVFAKK